MTLPDLSELREATGRLVRAIDHLRGDDWDAPSGCAGWDRRMLAGHLALNGEALTGVLGGGGAVPMYPSQEARDHDIAVLGRSSETEVRDRLFASATAFLQAVGGVTDWTASFERTPGAGPIPFANIVGMRMREVEIHHADLAIGYTRLDWPSSFCRELVELYASRVDAEVVATDTDLRLGSGETVTGTTADLAWWLTGRGTGEGLTTPSGDLPRIGAL